MQVKVESNSALERTVTVEVPEDKIATEVESRLKSLSQTTRIQGFRPGKAPLKIIQQRFGDQVRQEVVGKVLQSSLSEAITQENLRLAGNPEIGKFDAEQGKGLSYTAKFEVLPEIQLSPVEELEIEKAACEVTEEDIDKMVEVLRNQNFELQDVEREAAAEDIIEVDYTGYIEGEAFEGGSASDFKIDLSQKRLIDGFEAGLIGKKTGEEVTLNLAFPENYHVGDLAGKPAEFKVTVKRVSEKVLPELNDEFYQKFGIEEGGEEAFRRQIKDHMTGEVEQVLRNRLRESVMKALQQANQVELPAVLIKQEKQRLKAQFEQNLKNQGLNIEDMKHPDDDGLFEEQARERVALQLIIAELIRSHDIKAAESKVRELVMKYAQNYQDPAAIINWYYSDKNRLAEVEAQALENEVVDWVVERANVTNTSLTFDECMNKGQTESV